jgi:hypothetical protein
VVQKYLEKHSAPAGVLLASVPVSGASRGLLRIMARHPLRSARASLTGKSLHALSTPQVARENFYSASTPESDVERYSGLSGCSDQSYCGRTADGLERVIGSECADLLKHCGAKGGAKGIRTPDLLDANETTRTFATLDHVGCDRKPHVTALEQLGSKGGRRI